MSRAVRFLPEARQYLIETRQWYDLRQAGFGAVFALAFADAIERMQAQPPQLSSGGGFNPTGYPPAVSIRHLLPRRDR